jgi:hypothetical protein
MTATGKLKAIVGAAILACPIYAVSAQPAPPPPGPPTKPALPLEYAAKFVCGTNPLQGAVSPAAAAGIYYTAVNIHNPNLSNELTYKVVLAPRDKPAGLMTPFQPFMGMKYDWAFDIDCRLMRANLQQAGIPVSPTDFITGFLVIQSIRELDVVAVYTAAPGNNQVASIHTERVQLRKVQ